MSILYSHACTLGFNYIMDFIITTNSSMEVERNSDLKFEVIIIHLDASAFISSHE